MNTLTQEQWQTLKSYGISKKRGSELIAEIVSSKETYMISKRGITTNAMDFIRQQGDTERIHQFEQGIVARMICDELDEATQIKEVTMASKKSLEAAAATAGLFTEATEQEQPKTKKAPRQQPTPEAKRETATFSVKIDTDVLKRWRVYASIDGYGDKGKLTEAALVEYMNRHKLSPEQQKKFDTLVEL